jgi:hypothetical protein
VSIPDLLTRWASSERCGEARSLDDVGELGGCDLEAAHRALPGFAV